MLITANSHTKPPDYLIEAKAKRYRQNQDIYDQEEQQETTFGHQGYANVQDNDIASMSVDDIIQTALLRRDQQRQSAKKQVLQTTPPTHDRYRTVENENFGHSPEQFHRTPQPVFTSRQDLIQDQNHSKSYDEEIEDSNKNNIIERKVEEVLRRFIGSSQMSSIQGSREGSLPRQMNSTDQYWQMHPQASGYYPSYAPPMQQMFSSNQDIGQSDIVNMKKQIDDLVNLSCIIHSKCL